MGSHFNIGLKLHSINVALIPDALRLKKNGVFDYIELYIIPYSYKKTIDVWKGLDIPYVIHAPHSFHGVNLAQADKWETNLQRFNEARQFANDLGSDIIIVHGGNNGSFEETVRQIRLFNEKRIVLENKPKLGIHDEACVGWSPSEFRLASDAGVLYGIALDFCHASCAACSSGIDVMVLVKEFMIFSPKVFHLSDGDISSEKDVHFNLGNGNLNLSEFISVIPEGGFVTIETPRDSSRGLEDFVNDVHYLRNIFSQKGDYKKW